MSYSKKSEDRCMFVYFEDLCYKYNETKKRIEMFIGLDESSHNQSRFFPDQSIKNTKLFEKNLQFHSDIEIIKRELADYLYKYDK